MRHSIDCVCYLCGKQGADSKDHVPPKCFLPESSYKGYQRITLPAHRTCNAAASGDEEYVRDLLVQEAVALRLPKADVLAAKVWRAWAGKGWNRYQRFLRKSHVVRTYSPIGLYTGSVLGVVPDLPRVGNVCRKIVRGIVYHDSSTMLEELEVMVAPLTVADALRERERNRGEAFWLGMSSEHCHHDTCSDTVALRRFYEGVPADSNEVMIHAYVAIIMWNLFAVCQATFPLKRVGRADFRFGINTENGTWQRNPEYEGRQTP